MPYFAINKLFLPRPADMMRVILQLASQVMAGDVAVGAGVEIAALIGLSLNDQTSNRERIVMELEIRELDALDVEVTCCDM